MFLRPDFRVLATSALTLALACSSEPAGSTDDTGASTTAATTSSSTSGSTSTPTTGDASTSGDTTTAAGTTGDTTTGAAELDPRVAACLRIDVCEADGGQPFGIQTCLAHALDVPWRWGTTGASLLALQAMDCKLAAADCEGVRACTPALADFTAGCADNAGGDLCDGDTWVVCDPLGAPFAAMDCSAAGLACNKDIWAGCGAEPCEFGVTEATCDGDTLTQCDASGFLVRIDCPSQYASVNVNAMDGEHVYAIAGETCGFDKMRNANGCIGTGDDCGFFSQACDGDVLETCAGGKLAHRDCAAVAPAGQGCGFWQSGPFAGAATCGLVGPACDLADDEACDGSTLKFCDWDQPGSVDCQAQGLGACVTGERGGRTIAWCAG